MRRLIVLFSALLNLAVPALTQELGSGATPAVQLPESDVNTATGNFIYSIPIRVPVYRGIEPKLSLTYSSQAGNGDLGVGWQLLGAESVIEKKSPRMGAFQNASNDVYTLDGVELLPCTSVSTGLSPSCDTARAAYGSSANYYATKIESYKRILFNPATNQWTIWDQSGVKSTYSVFSYGNSKLWRRSEQMDTMENTVTYKYKYQQYLIGVDSRAWYYLDYIKYNTSYVIFHWESRPDVESQAMGWRTPLRYKSSRLKAIDICTNPNTSDAPTNCALSSTANARRVRIYELNYSQSVSTGVSRLANVREYGKNATGTGGDVTGGEGLPTISFTYRVEHGGTPTASAEIQVLSSSDARHNWDRVTGDFDGDGHSDMLIYDGSNADTLKLLVLHSNGDGSFTAASGNTVTHMVPGAGTATYTGYRLSIANLDGDKDDDILLYRTDRSSNTGVKMWVLLSNGIGSSFAVKTMAKPIQTGNYGFYESLLGDVDGDGKTDVVLTHARNSSWGIATHTLKSNGDGTFNAISQDSGVTGGGNNPLGTGSYGALGYQRALADVTGDGRADLVFTYGDNANGGLSVTVLRAQPDGSFALAEPGGPVLFYGSYGAPGWQRTLADMNGDGMADLFLQYASASGNEGVYTQVLLSTGSGSFVRTGYDVYPGNHIIATSDYASTGWTRTIGDANGDGKADILFAWADGTGNGFRTLTALSKGDGNFYLGDPGSPSTTGSYSSSYWKRVPGDADGDGSVDMIFTHIDLNGNVKTRVLYQNSMSHTLVQIVNGYGGSALISYKPSSKYPVGNGNNPPLRICVNTLALRDGRSANSQTSFSYEGGTYDRADRRFLGWSTVKKTFNAHTCGSACPYEKTTYYTDYARATKPSQISRYDGNNILLSKIDIKYAPDTTPPFSALETSRREYAYDNTGSSFKYTNIARTFDVYGNIVTVAEDPSNDRANDETFTEVSYSVNNARYIVNRPYYRKVYAGMNNRGPMNSWDSIYYDGLAIASPPIAGYVTKMGRHESSTSTWYYTQSTYNAFGSLSSITDQNGNQTTFIYDTDGTDEREDVFIVETRLPGYSADSRRKVTQTWDPVCQVMLTTTDDNGTLRHEYDQHCRRTLTRARGSANYVSYQYCSFTSVTNQCGQVADTATNKQYMQRSFAGPDGDIWERVYFDGLGRPHRTDRVDGGSIVRSEVRYDDRGRVIGKTEPFRITNTAVWTKLEYDALNRLTRVVFADNASIVRDYRTPWEVVTTNPDGDQTRRVFNGQGMLLRSGIRDASTGTWYETIYAYQRGRPNYIRYCGSNTACVAGAAIGPTVHYTYDFRGNLIQLSDPDKGVTTYAYDAGGRLTDEQDALGNKTHYTYDAVNRLLTMTIRYGALDAKTYAWTYDEARTGYNNYGRVTTIDDGDGDITVLNYDAAGRLLNMTRTIDGIAYPFSYSYYTQGAWLRGMRFPDGDVFGDDPSTTTVEASLEYKQGGRLTKIPSLIGQITYTPWGGVDTLYRANGVSAVVKYTYDPTRTWLQAVGTNECTRTYSRTASGRLYAMQESGSHTINPCTGRQDYVAGEEGLTSYTTTPWSGPPAEQTIDYSPRFDGNMNALEPIGSYQYDPTRVHFVTAAGAHTYTADGAGNMATGNGYQFAYDGLNRLATVSGPATFKAFYGANGRRKKVVSGGTTTIYVTDDYEITNGIATKYIRVNGQVVGKKIGVGVSGLTRNYSMEGFTAGQNIVPAGWPTGTNTDTTTPVNWHVSNRRKSGGAAALRYGNDAANDYIGTGANSGEIDSQTFNLPAGAARYGFSVDIFANTRAGNGADLYSIEVRSRAAGVLATFSKAFLGDGNTGGAFKNYTFPLPSSVGGKSDLYVHFMFNTVDRSPSGYEGVYVDNLQLTADAGIYYLLSDAMGSVFSVEDARGLTVKRTVYSPHGTLRSGLSSGAHGETRGFAGRQHDVIGSLTLLFDGSRYLDPGIARYLTPSPGMSTAINVGLNNYAFAGNDPVVNIVNPLASSREAIAAQNLASSASGDVTVALAQEQQASSAMYGWRRVPSTVTARVETVKFDPMFDYSSRTDADDLFHRNEIGQKGDAGHTNPDRDGSGKWLGTAEGNSFMSALARDVPLMNFFASEHDTDSNWGSLGINFPGREYADNFPLQFAMGVGAGAMLPAHPSLILNSALKYSTGMTREQGLVLDVFTGNAPAILAAGTDVLLGQNEDVANAAGFLLIPHNAIATTINAIRDFIRWW